MYQQLGAQDAQFIYSQSPTNLTHVMAVSVYDPSTAPAGVVQLQDIVEHVRSRLHVSPVFRRKLYHPPGNIDHPYWTLDDHFDLEAHITHAKLPAPADWRQFATEISRYFSRPMDMNRPLWDIHVIEGLDHVEGAAPGSYAVITRIHHSAIDGIGMSQLFAALSDKDAKGTPIIELHPTKTPHGTAPEATHMLGRALRNTLSSPVDMVRTVAKYAPEFVRSARKRRAEGDVPEGKTQVPETRFNGSVSPHKQFDALEFPLSDFKAIKSAVEGATINDVVLAVSGAALRTYLQKHEELPESSLISWVPVSMKKDPAQAEVQAEGNNLSGMIVAIGTDVSDPLERLRAIQKSTAASKAAESGVGARLVTELTQKIPSATMAGIAALLTNERFAPRFCNLFVSNVAGSPVPLYMNGARCTSTYGLAPLANGMGLFIAVGSYNGKMVISVITDKKIIPDIEFFRECIEKSVATYLEAARAASP